MVKEQKIRQMGGREGQPLEQGWEGEGRGGLGLEPCCPAVVARAFWSVFTLKGEGGLLPPLTPAQFSMEGAVLR